MFEPPDDSVPLKCHLSLVDGPHHPSDEFLRLHFQRCISYSACGGDPGDDYADQEISNFMDELGIYDNEINSTDPRWLTPLGQQVHAHLLRQKLAWYVILL
jgi:hypothetical protein